MRSRSIDKTKNRHLSPASFFFRSGEASFFSPSSLIQPKLTIGQVGDPFEREADHVADQVMRSAAPTVQRVCEACEKEEVQRMPYVQPASNEVGEASSDLVSLGAGQPMSPGERSFFEPRFNRSFEHVRIHRGTSASQKAASINAKAYTHQNNIVFGAGQYNPSSEAGRKLMAHELTHTIQQGASSRQAHPGIQRKEFVPWPGQEGHDIPGTRSRNGDIISEQVGRLGDPSYAQPDPALLEFDIGKCQLTVRKEINFVRAGSGKKQLSQERFDALKARILNIANDRLNGWVTISVEGDECCELECVNREISVQVVTTEGTGSHATTVNLHPKWGRENAANIGKDASNRTIWHEMGHVVLGAADEYQDKERAGGPRPPSRVNRSDWSIMSDDYRTRRSLMHARHFSHLPAWLKRRFPACDFYLKESTRPLVVEVSPTFFGGGYRTFSGAGGLHYSLGLDLGIPLDRLRRLELIMGPRFNLIVGTDRTAFLMGFRAGLEGQFGSTGLRLGGYAEVGGAGVTNLETGSFGTLPYTEGAIGIGYSSGRATFGAEFGVGGRDIPAPDSSGASTYGGYFRLGLNMAVHF